MASSSTAATGSWLNNYDKCFRRVILRSSHSPGPTPMSVPPSDRGYAGSWPRCVGAECTLRVPLEWSDGAGTLLVLLKDYEHEQGEHHDGAFQRVTTSSPSAT